MTLKNPVNCICLALMALTAPCFSFAGDQLTVSPAVSVSRDADGGLVVSGGDCAALERQATALSDWRKRLGEVAGPADACRCAVQDCSLRISAAAPEFVNLTHGTKAGRWGPNCWNTALAANEILAARRFTSPEEMTFWMKSPLCRALRAGEKPQPGDIVAIRGQAGEEEHGFVYLTPELSFSKNYLTVAAPYALQSPEEVYAEFPVTPACRKPGSSGSGCAAYSDYFRCTTLADHQQASPGPQDEEYLRAAAAVSSAEAAISDLAIRWKTDPDLKNHAAEILAAQEKALLPVRQLAQARSGFYWSALLLRVDSLLHQISLI